MTMLILHPRLCKGKFKIRFYPSEGPSAKTLITEMDLYSLTSREHWSKNIAYLFDISLNAGWSDFKKDHKKFTPEEIGRSYTSKFDEKFLFGLGSSVQRLESEYWRETNIGPLGLTIGFANRELNYEYPLFDKEVRPLPYPNLRYNVVDCMKKSQNDIELPEEKLK